MGLEKFAANLVAALIGWITEKTADMVMGGAQRLALGDPEVRVLRVVVDSSVSDTVAWTGLDEKQAADLLAALMEREPGVAALPDTGRTADGLREGLRSWIMALDQPEFDSDGYLSGIGINPVVFASHLADQVMAGIEADARSGGPLGNLAEWLWRDAIGQQLDRIETGRAGTGLLTELLDYAEALGPSSAEGLHGRDQEIWSITEFCASPVQYYWLQGDVWTGKTAVASWVFRNPPEHTTVIAFFVRQLSVSYRTAGNYVSVMAGQLAALASRPVPSREAGSHQLADLLRDAAAKVAEAGPEHRLLLIVDGLDEDCTTSGETIADLLPRNPPPNVRVLVTSRPLLRTLRSDHPLAQCVPVLLQRSDLVQDLRADAEKQMEDAVRQGGPSRQLAGLMTAARGGLAVRDLAELTELDSGEIRDVIEGRLGRNLRWAKTGVLEFAHASLFDVARDYFKDDLPKYGSVLLRWANTYRDRDWPEDTPGFLLSAFHPDLLLAESGVRTAADAGRLAELVADRSRHDRMLERLGADGPAVTELKMVADAAVKDPSRNLGLLALIAFERDRLSTRNRTIPRELPAVWARLGETGRALELAQSLPHLYRRAEALMGVAEATAAADPELAEFAAAHTGYRDWQAEALARAAIAAPVYWRRFLRPARKLAAETERAERRATAMAAVAGALTAYVPQEALECAKEFSGKAWLASKPLIAIVAAAARAGNTQLATTAAAECRLLAAELPGLDRDSVLGQVIRPLWPVDQEAAGALIEEMDRPEWVLADLAVQTQKSHPALAAELAQRVLAAERIGSGSERQTLAAFAMAVMDPEAGRRYAQDIADPQQRAEALERVVKAVATAGPEWGRWAENLAKSIEDPHIQARALRMVALATIVSDASVADRAVEDIVPDEERATTFARMAADVVTQDPERAVSLARKSEATARRATDFGRSARRLAALAQATAPIDARLAEACADVIDTRPDWRAAALTAVIASIAPAPGERAHADNLVSQVNQTLSDPKYRDTLAMITALIIAARSLGDPWRSALAYKALMKIEGIGKELDLINARAGLARALAPTSGPIADEATVNSLWRSFEPVLKRGPRDSRDELWWKAAAHVAAVTAPFDYELAAVITGPLVTAARDTPAATDESMQEESQSDPRDSEDMAEVIAVIDASQSPGAMLEPSGGSWLVGALSDIATALPQPTYRLEALDLLDAAVTNARGIPHPDPRGEALATAAEALITLNSQQARVVALEASDELKHERGFFSGKAAARIAAVAGIVRDPALTASARRELARALCSDSWIDALPALTILAPDALRSACATVTIQEEKTRARTSAA